MTGFKRRYARKIAAGEGAFCVSKFVIMTGDDVAEGTRRGESEAECLRRRFIEEHGLTFSVEELKSGERFRWQESSDGKFFKVTFLGDVQ